MPRVHKHNWKAKFIKENRTMYRCLCGARLTVWSDLTFVMMGKMDKPPAPLAQKG